MRIGVPRETKDNEYRVGLTPDGARQIVARGHEVLVERNAGQGSGFSDELYAQAGGKLVGVEEAWSAPDLVVKVKEPNPQEVERLRAGQTLFAYLHLAPNRPLTDGPVAVEAVANHELDEAAAIGDSYGVRVLPRLERAHAPGPAIVAEADARNAEIIVLGSPRRALTAKHAAVFGSTVDYVLKHADCRVLVTAAEAP